MAEGRWYEDVNPGGKLPDGSKTDNIVGAIFVLFVIGCGIVGALEAPGGARQLLWAFVGCSIFWGPIVFIAYRDHRKQKRAAARSAGQSHR